MNDHTNGGLGGRIKEAIRAAGVNQTKLAKRLGTEPGVVNGWINKGVIPEGRFVLQIPEILGCDANWLLGGQEVEEPGPSLDYIAGRLTDLLKDMNRGVAYPSAPAPKPEATGAQPQGPSALKSGFLTAIKGFSDLEVEQICGISHETVRKWRLGSWPVRGPNRDSVAKIRVMIARHDVIIKENAVLSGEKLPAFALGLIEFAQDRKGVEDFCKKHPKLGWLSIADDLAKAFRELDRMTICDEFMWIGYKHAHDFDPETASPVTLKDYKFNVPELIRAIEKKSDPDQ